MTLYDTIISHVFSTCSICLEPIFFHPILSIRLLPCRHVFHFCCMSTYTLCRMNWCAATHTPMLIGRDRSNRGGRRPLWASPGKVCICPLCRQGISYISTWYGKQTFHCFVKQIVEKMYRTFNGYYFIVFSEREMDAVLLDCPPRSVHILMFSCILRMYLRGLLSYDILHRMYNEFVLYPKKDTVYKANETIGCFLIQRRRCF